MPQIFGHNGDRDAILLALESNQIQAWFQPKLRLNDHAVSGAEALVRWVFPDGTVLLPKQFLPRFAQENLEMELLYFMIEKSVKTQQTWKKFGFDIEIGINLPSRLLDVDLLPERLYEHVLHQGGTPDLIGFELTENEIHDNQPGRESAMYQLRAKGFKLAECNAGLHDRTSIESMAVPFTELKINRALINRCTVDNNAANEVDSIIKLGHRLGVNVIAEGVESLEQLNLLRSLRCHSIQGFLFSGALTDTLFLNFLKKTASPEK